MSETSSNVLVLTNIDASSIILGFTGSIGSGASFIAQGIRDESNNQYRYFRLSDLIRNQLKEDGNFNPSIADMQNKGNYLRQQYGGDCLTQSLFNEITKKPEYYEHKHFIIDGIKNEDEIKFLRHFSNFFLFSIHASKETRKKRCIKNGTFNNDALFDIADKRDELEEDDFGQQVKKCNDLSDIILLNEDMDTASSHAKQDYIRGISRKYIEPIERLYPGSKDIPSFPDMNELCMTIAYSLSKKSSCLKRKVGAVIAEVDMINDSDCRPCVVSSGYNEIPLGSKSCMDDPMIRKCHRDIIQEREALNYHYCPDCGGEIIFENTICLNCGTNYNVYKKRCEKCNKELDIKMFCSACRKDIKQYLPGGKASSGKLLDMCRALHAEETALLKLTRQKIANSCLILYTTTFPCTLCANKIVSVGIKEVVYAEPYPMEDAKQILEKAKIKITPFQGIKSSAYFRIYS